MTRGLERIILENPKFVRDWKAALRSKRAVFELTETEVPDGVRPNGVPRDTYYGYKTGCTTGNADLVVCTKLENGKPAVLALLRGHGVPFAGKWDMVGGTILAYQDMTAFLSGKSAKECSITIEPEALIGVYRNDAPDVPSSVIGVCCVATVSVGILRSVVASKEHHDWRLLTLAEINALPKEQTYWYAMHVWTKVLTAAPKVL